MNSYLSLVSLVDISNTALSSSLVQYTQLVLIILKFKWIRFGLLLTKGKNRSLSIFKGLQPRLINNYIQII